MRSDRIARRIAARRASPDSHKMQWDALNRDLIGAWGAYPQAAKAIEEEEKEVASRLAQLHGELTALQAARKLAHEAYGVYRSSTNDLPKQEAARDHLRAAAKLLDGVPRLREEKLMVGSRLHVLADLVSSVLKRVRQELRSAQRDYRGWRGIQLSTVLPVDLAEVPRNRDIPQRDTPP